MGGYLTQPCQLLICLQLLLLYSQCSAILCSHDQSSALLQFKQLFSFEKHASRYCDEQISRPKMMSWKEDSDCCSSWDGVTCDSATGHVIGLDLSCSWLHGDIPSNSSLFLLPRLRNLNLAFNDFNYSKISSGFTQFPSLTLLNLSFSNFTGSIPASLGNITHLAYLDLMYNSFSGHIPSSFSNLHQLRHLNLWYNNFVGKIPDIFTNLTQLSYLALGRNQLTGSIPSSVFELVNLTKIYLSFNNFSGSVELYDFAKLKNLKYLALYNISLSLSTKLTVNSSFPNLLGLRLWACNISEFPDILRTQHQLEWLDLSQNQIHGRIPRWMWDVGVHSLYFLRLSQNFLTSIDHLPWKNLQYLYLDSNLLQGSLPNLPPHILSFFVSNNNLTGEIPSSFCNLSSIQYLYLYNNSLSGQIPQCLGNSTLQYLDLGMNNFQGSIPQTFAKGCSLTYLWLNDNLLEGPLPPSLINCVNLSYLDVGNNNLSGEIPESFGNSTLEILDMRMNKFSGSIPQTFAKGCSLTSLWLNGNHLKGPLPPSVINCVNLTILDVGNNNLSGPIPESFGNSTLEVLDMSMNKFSGSLPQIFAKSCVLTSLNLNDNRMEGSLPPSLVNCHYLEVLDVGSNQIDDTFPHWLEVLPELQVLILRSNQFRGPIGDTKTRAPFPKLRIIDLSHNNLTDFLPVWYLDSFKAMMHGDNNSVGVDYMEWQDYSYYYSIFFTMKGNDIKMERILTTFATIDLSSNKFQGGIPELVGKLNSLKGLNISHNNLTGAIPSSLRNLIELESLDLSSNKLAGHIPTQLASLNYLSVLNLSNNQLEGPIPRGPQLNTFGNDSYSGNSGLCGFPLSKSCSIDEAPAPTSPTRFHEGDDDSSWFDWKFAKVGYASGVVIGVSIGYMVFATGRPRFFARMIEGKQSKKVKRVIKRGTARRRNL